MKILLLGILLLSLAGCGRNDTDINSTEMPHILATTDASHAEVTTPISVEDTHHTIVIVSEYHPEYLEKLKSLEPTHEMLELCMQYAEYSEQGIQLVNASKEFGDGRLIYTIKDAYVVSAIGERGIVETGFSVDTKMYWTDTGGWQEANKPIWLKEDGRIDESVKVILVDISVYNDGVTLDVSEDKFGNPVEPHVFSADSFVWLSNMKPDHQGWDYGYSSINYFSELQEDTNYAYRFQLLPGETKDFTVGFVVGEGSYFTSEQDFYLCNTCGNPDGIFIRLNLE